MSGLEQPPSYRSASRPAPRRDRRSPFATAGEERPCPATPMTSTDHTSTIARSASAVTTRDRNGISSQTMSAAVTSAAPSSAVISASWVDETAASFGPNAVDAIERIRSARVMNPALAIGPVARTAATAACSAPTASCDQPCATPSTTTDGPTPGTAGADVTGVATLVVAGADGWPVLRSARAPTTTATTTSTTMRMVRRIVRSRCRRSSRSSGPDRRSSLRRSHRAPTSCRLRRPNSSTRSGRHRSRLRRSTSPATADASAAYFNQPSTCVISAPPGSEASAAGSGTCAQTGDATIITPIVESAVATASRRHGREGDGIRSPPRVRVARRMHATDFRFTRHRRKRNRSGSGEGIRRSETLRRSLRCGVPRAADPSCPVRQR